MDLFTPIVPESKQHHNFSHILRPIYHSPEIDVIQGWADDFKDRDGKFVKEFQTTFNSSFWELYLFACFKELGCKVDFSYEAPDFVVNSDRGSFVAEATIANAPDGFRPQWEGIITPETLDQVSINEIIRLATLRLANAIDAKYKKYQKSYSKLSHVQGKPFVICLAPFEQPFFFVQTSQALQRVLYTYEQPLIISNPLDGSRRIVGESQRKRVQKKPETEISLGLFTDSRMAEISAVIFSSTATWGKVRALAKESSVSTWFRAIRYMSDTTQANAIMTPKAEYRETLLDGLHLCLNPFANIPLNYELFENREIAIHDYDSHEHEYLVYPPNGFLIQRYCFSVRGVDNKVLQQVQTYAETLEQKVYSSLPNEVWREDELISVGGQIQMFAENYMAHYRGWTIIIALDTIDNDWMAQAIVGTHFSLPEYIEANQKLDSTSDPASSRIIASSSFSSEEEAFTAIKGEIDVLLL
ncbi:hypothetical protein [Leptolyngbya sp. AN10]|uniref:hypothetical protein n=1 Tax=Leptolyngbya sp. AN10 TaxID=3423365 RepID=UPI003D31DA95